MGNLGEMDRLIGNTLSSETESGRNRISEGAITNNIIELVIKKLPINKFPRPDSFKSAFCQTYKAQVITYSQTIPKI